MSKYPDILIYIHFPYCELKCPYCDFNSHVSTATQEERHLFSYKAEVDFFLSKIGKRHNVRSVFFGGGTPSLMKPNTVFQVLEFLRNHSLLEWENPEVTLEANPSSSEYEKFCDFKNAGINRLSIGVQSFNEEHLKFLGRKHNSNEAKKALEMANKIFEKYSFDLIYCLPNQSATEWKEELEFAISNYGKNHLSAYTLTIEKGTKFFSMHQKNLFSLPPNEDEFYDITNDVFAKYGFERYEISNYAKAQNYCAHNLGYWESIDYMGIGAGAHGRIMIDSERFATQNFALPEKYLEQVKLHNNALQVFEKLSHQEIINETLLMNLRTKNGINLEFVNKKYNINLLDFINKKNLLQMKEKGMIECTLTQLKVTPKYLNILNSIIQKLL